MKFEGVQRVSAQVQHAKSESAGREPLVLAVYHAQCGGGAGQFNYN